MANSIKLIEGFEKIAAGEVIERPSSVVKELVENSLDAGSTEIFLTVKNAGKDLIEVIDNGSGIKEEDIIVAFQRHTSSKIDSADELDALHTFGFRGEALASIAAVSQIELISRTKEQEYAMQLTMEDGKNPKTQQIGGRIGTIFRIKNLFYNYPVRQKFMKANKTEIGHISNVITRYSLAYPNIHFKLIHNGLTLINSPKFTPSKEMKGKQTLHEKYLHPEAYLFSISTIYTPKISKQMIQIQHHGENFFMFGFFGKPEIARASKSASTIFVNHRLVENDQIMKSVNNAYKDYLMRHKFPFFVLFIEVPPANVDFNIHPSKKKVRFIDEINFIQTFEHDLTQLFKSQLQNAKNRENIPEKKEHTLSEYHKIHTKSIIKGGYAHLTKPKSSGSSRTTRKTTFSPKIYSDKTISQNIPKEKSSERKKSIQSRLFAESKPQEPIFQEYDYSITQLPPLFALAGGMQAGKNYLIFQNEEEIIIIDQHAAHERINLEKVQKAFSEKLPIQELLQPIKIDTPPNETEFIKQSLMDIKKYGFDLDHFGGHTFIIRKIPAFLHDKIRDKNFSSIVIDTCLELIEKGRADTFNEIKHSMMQYMACHMSITAGDEIWSQQKIKKLLNELNKCENPHHCAHGRPTYIKFTYKELDKMFHRT